MAKRDVSKILGNMKEPEVEKEPELVSEPDKRPNPPPAAGNGTRAQVLAYLRTGKTLDRVKGVNEMGIFDVPSRIAELIKMGYKIQKGTIQVTLLAGGKPKNLATYRLIDPNQII
jgi:hypothetical protein